MQNLIKLTVIKDKKETSTDIIKGSNLLQSLYDLGFYEIPNNCGGRGTCKRCQVNTQEKGEVISCLTRISEDITVELTKEDISLQRDDTLIVKSNFFSSKEQVEFELTKIDSKSKLGIAIDIGTTTIVIQLFNLDRDSWLGEEKSRNQQNGYGSDVISRIDFSNKNGVVVLRNVLQNQLNQMIDNLMNKLNLDKKQIYKCSIAANTVMEHFLLGLSPKTIGVAPFKPLSFFGEIYEPKELNLTLDEQTKIYVFPAIAGYVGGDISAGILTTNMHNSKQLAFLLDIGTNGEMVLGSKEQLIACATAAGPAFEGAEIEKGMLGVPGAVDQVFYNPDDKNPITFTTISDLPPQGFCGSGLLDILAVGIRAGLIQDSGLISDKEEVEPNLKQYLTTVDDQNVIAIDKGRQIYITQKDIRKLQSAKGAIAAGLVTLLEATNTDPKDIEDFYLAGGFGSAINVESLAVVGMIPESFVAKTKVIGNSSLAGASQVLKTSSYLEELQLIKDKCEYIELSTDPTFTDNYIESMFFTEF